MSIKIACISEAYGKISENFYLIKSYLPSITLNMSTCFSDAILVNTLSSLTCVNFLSGLDTPPEHDELDKSFKL